jgi:hypothetical protein
VTAEHYFAIAKKLGYEKTLPAGCHVQIAGVSPDGHLRVISVWDDRETADKFHQSEVHGERKDLLTSGVKREIWDLEHMIVTDDEAHVTKK